jgi:hypothetical protein
VGQDARGFQVTTAGPCDEDEFNHAANDFAAQRQLEEDFPRCRVVIVVAIIAIAAAEDLA